MSLPLSSYLVGARVGKPSEPKWNSVLTTFARIKMRASRRESEPCRVRKPVGKAARRAMPMSR